MVRGWRCLLEGFFLGALRVVALQSSGRSEGRGSFVVLYCAPGVSVACCKDSQKTR